MDKKQSKIEQIKEENAKKRSSYKPSVEQQQKLVEFADLFEGDRQSRDNDVKRYFNERSLENYLDDCQKRVNGYVEPRRNVEDWQVRYRNLLTRNKMLAVLSRFATIRMKMKFKDKNNSGDYKKLKIFNALYDHYEDLDNGDMKQFELMWTAWQDGTVVDWTTPEKKTKKIKDLTDYDAETGEYKMVEKVLKTWKITSRIIPLQDIWFGNIRERDEQEQPHIWLRFIPTYQDFIKDFGKFKNSQYVSSTTGEAEGDDVFFRQQDIGSDKVELLWYMNIWEDRMIIWGNKVELYDGPIPYRGEDGKFYPITIGVYEMIAADFIYGKSGADKMSRDQDLIDLFYRKLADRTILTSNPPIFTESNPDLPEKISLSPGAQIPVENLAGIREFAFNPNTSTEIINTLKVFQYSANLTGGADIAQGVAQSNRTATAEMLAEQNTKQMVGLFQFFIENFMKRRALIKAKHILQGINVPEKASAKVVDGKVKELKTEFGTFTEKNVVLPNSQLRGDIVYEIVGSSEELLEDDTIGLKEFITTKKGRPTKFVYITPDYFDNFLADVEPVVGSSQEQSPSLKKSIETEFIKGYMSFFPELYMQKQTEFAKDYLDVYEKEIDRLLGAGQQPVMMGQEQQMGQPGSALPNTQPQYANVPKELRNMAA
jgi:hypothetical protein